MDVDHPERDVNDDRYGVNNMHPSTRAILRYFASDHLPPKLRRVSEPFGILATQIANSLPPIPETTVAVRALLNAKDAAVRAALDLPDDAA